MIKLTISLLIHVKEVEWNANLRENLKNIMCMPLLKFRQCRVLKISLNESGTLATPNTNLLIRIVKCK